MFLSKSGRAHLVKEGKPTFYNFNENVQIDGNVNRVPNLNANALELVNQQLGAARNQMRIQQNVIGSLKQQIADFENKGKKFEIQCRDYLKKIEDNAVLINTLKQQVNDNPNRENDIRKVLEQNKIITQELNNQIQSLKAENIGIKKGLSQKDDNYRKLENDYKLLTLNYDNVINETKKLRLSLNVQNVSAEASAENEKTIRELEAIMQNNNRTIENLRTENQQLLQTTSLQTQNLIDLKSLMEQKEAEYQNEIRKLQDNTILLSRETDSTKVLQLENEISISKAQLQNLQQQVNYYKSQIENNNQELIVLRSSEENLKLQLIMEQNDLKSYVDSANKSVREYNGRLEAVTTRLREVENNAIQKDTYIGELSRQLEATLNQLNQYKQNYQGNIDEYQKKLSEFNSIYSSTSTAYSESMNKSSFEIANKQQDITNLQQIISNMKQNNILAEKKFNELTQNYAQLEIKYNNILNLYNETSENLYSLKSISEEEAFKYEAKLGEINAQKDLSDSKYLAIVEELQSVKSSIQKELLLLRSKNDELEKLVESLQQQLRFANLKVNEQESTLKDLKEKKEDMENREQILLNALSEIHKEFFKEIKKLFPNYEDSFAEELVNGSTYTTINYIRGKKEFIKLLGYAIEIMGRLLADGSKLYQESTQKMNSSSIEIKLKTDEFVDLKNRYESLDNQFKKLQQDSKDSSEELNRNYQTLSDENHTLKQQMIDIENSYITKLDKIKSRNKSLINQNVLNTQNLTRIQDAYNKLIDRIKRYENDLQTQQFSQSFNDQQKFIQGFNSKKEQGTDMEDINKFLQKNTEMDVALNELETNILNSLKQNAEFPSGKINVNNLLPEVLNKNMNEIEEEIKIDKEEMEEENLESNNNAIDLNVEEDKIFAQYANLISNGNNQHLIWNSFLKYLPNAKQNKVEIRLTSIILGALFTIPGNENDDRNLFYNGCGNYLFGTISRDLRQLLQIQTTLTILKNQQDLPIFNFMLIDPNKERLERAYKSKEFEDLSKVFQDKISSDLLRPTISNTLNYLFLANYANLLKNILAHFFSTFGHQSPIYIHNYYYLNAFVSEMFSFLGCVQLNDDECFVFGCEYKTDVFRYYTSQKLNLLVNKYQRQYNKEAFPYGMAALYLLYIWKTASECLIMCGFEPNLNLTYLKTDKNEYFTNGIVNTFLELATVFNMVNAYFSTMKAPSEINFRTYQKKLAQSLGKEDSVNVLLSTLSMTKYNSQRDDWSLRNFNVSNEYGKNLGETIKENEPFTRFVSNVIPTIDITKNWTQEKLKVDANTINEHTRTIKTFLWENTTTVKITENKDGICYVPHVLRQANDFIWSIKELMYYQFLFNSTYGIFTTAGCVRSLDGLFIKNGKVIYSLSQIFKNRLDKSVNPTGMSRRDKERKTYK